MIKFKSFTQLYEIAMVGNVRSRSNKLGLGHALRTKSPMDDEKIHSQTKDHHIYRLTRPGLTRYTARHKQTGEAHLIVQGLERNNVLHIRSTAGSNESSIKAYEMYHHLIKQGVTLASDSKQSEGGRRIWQKLSQARDVNVHGWYKGKPVNVKIGSDETHIEVDDTSRGTSQIRDMILVAHKK